MFAWLSKEQYEDLYGEEVTMCPHGYEYSCNCQLCSADFNTDIWNQRTDGQWSDWTKPERKRFKMKWKKRMNSLDCCDPPAPCPVREDILAENKIGGYQNWYSSVTEDIERCKKESAMNSAAHMIINAPAPTTESDENSSKREHLSHRLYDIYEAKKTKARTSFGLVDDPTPHSPQEIVNRIKSGNFVISKNWTEEMDTYSYNARTAVDYFRWRDPSRVEDKAGYQTWKKETLEPARTQLRDSIAIKDPQLALTELQAWEAE